MKATKKKGTDLILVGTKEVEAKIAVIRETKVIADADVAELYGVESREVNQAVRNNQDKFPADYMFELNKSELRDLKSKILTSNVSSARMQVSNEITGNPTKQ